MRPLRRRKKSTLVQEDDESTKTRYGTLLVVVLVLLMESTNLVSFFLLLPSADQLSETWHRKQFSVGKSIRIGSDFPDVFLPSEKYLRERDSWHFVFNARPWVAVAVLAWSGIVLAATYFWTQDDGLPRTVLLVLFGLACLYGLRVLFPYYYSIWDTVEVARHFGAGYAWYTKVLPLLNVLVYGVLWILVRLRGGWR